MKIKAAVAEAQGQDFEFRELELDSPRDDEILVEISAVGLCHTDLVFRDSPGGVAMALPAVLGHEGAGIVREVGKAVTKVAPGDAVLITFRSCGNCAQCRAGTPSYCDLGLVMNYAGCRLDGSFAHHHGDTPIRGNFFGQSSFASHALTYERNVVKLPAGSDLSLLAPLGCGIQTGAGAVLKALDCEPGSSIAIVGAGTVGLAAVMAAKHRGCSQIIAIDPIAERRALALELGATLALDPAAKSIASSIRAELPMGVNYVVDCSGVVSAMIEALSYMAPAATLGLIGVPSAPDALLPVPITAAISLGLRVRGIIEGDADPDSFIPELIALQASGALPFERLIATYPFSKLNEAIADQHAGKVVKVVLELAPSL